MSEFLFWSARRLVTAMKQGDLSASEVVGVHLERIEAVNPALNAVVQLTADAAIAGAAAADAKRARGEPLGVLHGLPITIKDSLDTAGIVTTGGTKGREHHVPTADAPAVARLLDAGAILLGKSNTPELTLSGETDNLIYGRTSNPFDLDRSPGGSSGGAAAIVAAGGAALDLGSDTGGSIREPAHYCGIAGIKPTTGRVPRTGHIVPFGLGAVDGLTQVGPMARYVEDLALALPVITGVDWQDPTLVPMPLGSPDDVDLCGLRIATYTDNGVTDVSSDVADTVRRAAAALAEDGLRIQEALPGGFARAARAVGRLRGADGGSIARRLLARAGTEKAGPHMAYVFADPTNLSAEEYSVIMEEADAARSEMLAFMADYDAIVCPASRTAARPHGASLADDYAAWSHCMVYNLTMWPGAVVRAGEDAQGLPLGVQIVARPWREDVALAVAARIELLLGGYRKPPL